MSRLIVLIVFIVPVVLFAQSDQSIEQQFSKADTLRGALRHERTSYDVQHYELEIQLDILNRSIAGYVEMEFIVLKNTSEIQVDLFENMSMDSIVMNNRLLDFRREFNAVFVSTNQLRKGETYSLIMHYHGQPTVAKRAPWDGGFVFAKDNNGRPWIGVACEGEGASLWWPNKDHLSDEPKTMVMRFIVPDSLMAVGNGDLTQEVQLENGRKLFEWTVNNPINNYNVTLNVGDYVHFSDEHTYRSGTKLPLDYYVLSYNKRKAEKHFKQIHDVLEAFDFYLGEYPFMKGDYFAMVETPYVGMEHQGAIAYGNKYMRGYLGRAIPEGQNWDYIIVHEMGHEWFGNSISAADMGDMWIHESFTTYLETLFIEYHYGEKSALDYLAGQMRYIQNKEPVRGPQNVNYHKYKSSDHYYKGAAILSTLRYSIGSAQFQTLLNQFYKEHQLSVIEAADFYEFINTRTEVDYQPFFNQYFESTEIPTLEMKLTGKRKKKKLTYRWAGDLVDNFTMPVSIQLRGSEKEIQITPSREWQTKKLKCKGIDFDKRKYLVRLSILD